METCPVRNPDTRRSRCVSAVLAVPVKIFSSLLTILAPETKAGAEGFEPSNTGFQRPVPYHLATPQYCPRSSSRVRKTHRRYSSTILWKYSHRGNGFASFTRKRRSSADAARICLRNHLKLAEYRRAAARQRSPVGAQTPASSSLISANSGYRAKTGASKSFVQTSPSHAGHPRRHGNLQWYWIHQGPSTRNRLPPSRSCTPGSTRRTQ